MKSKKKSHAIILGVFFLIGLSAGIVIMLLYPYFSHRQILLNKAADITEKYSRNQILDVNGYFGMSYLVYDLDGNCMDKIVSGFPDMAFGLDMEKYLQRLKGREATLCYDYLEISMQSNTRRQLSLVVAMPVKDNERTIGVFFLIRELEEVSHNLITFVFVWCGIFALLFLFFYLLNRKERELDALERTYIASMNHELKTPITSIKALTETLLDGYVTEPEKQLFYYSTILKEAKTLEATVQEILELSRLQSARDIFRKEAVSAADLFTPILNRYQAICEDMDICFEAPALERLTLPELYTAPSLASRTLDLLLHNATKFTANENGTIQVTFEAKRKALLICVRDNGCGISPDALPFIFDRFYQAENARNKNGSGLGLSIVKEILDGLGETVCAESEEGKGSVFSFTISTLP